MPVSRRVGVREVALRAGVSTQTVSRVINGATGVRAETSDRVLAAMAELGFRVNNAARALGTRKSRTIGVVAGDATLYGPTVAISELESAARERDRWIATAFVDAHDAGSVEAGSDWLVSQGVDGLIVVGPHEPTFDLLARVQRDVPVVGMHRGEGAAAQREGAALAVRHLLDLGHRRLVRLGGPPDWAEESARSRGYDDAVDGFGVDTVLRLHGDWSAAAGFAAAPDVSDAADRGATAVVVANDQMALGLIAGLAEQTISVPRDVSVVGFDDNPDAAYYRPSLTTVAIDIAGEARRCVGAALGDSPSPVADAPRLIARSSTAGA
jgi:DNA-binding LacI/PurR family transcriptional regulator